MRAAWCGTRFPVCECKLKLNVADLGQSHISKNKRTALPAQKLTITAYFCSGKNPSAYGAGGVCNATTIAIPSFFPLIRGGAPSDQLNLRSEKGGSWKLHSRKPNYRPIRSTRPMGSSGRPQMQRHSARNFLAGSSLFLDLDVLGKIVIFTLNFRSPFAGWECQDMHGRFRPRSTCICSAVGGTHF